MDTGVSTVNIDENDLGFEIIFEATSYPLPIVQGPENTPLPSGCVASSLEVIRVTGWIAVNQTGFSFSQNVNGTILQVQQL